MDILIKNLSAILGPENVLSKPDELLVYECDGLPQHKHRPRAVVFPSSTEQTAAVMKELAHANVPFTPRGAGTGLSGGALALNDGVVIELARMRKILRVDPINQLAVVQPGVVNLQVSRAVASYGLYYVPDPSSQPTCTIGGNIAEGAGGIHCLKYGTTTDHVLGCRVVLAGGEIVELGGVGVEAQGYDLLGTFIGSEGTFGIATEATLKLSQSPPAVRTLLAEFVEVNDASHAVSAIIAAGVMPAALEMMDREIIRAVEASVFAAGLPPDAGAALLIELDGLEADIDDDAARVTDICMEYGARTCRAARDESERKKLWAARKGAFGAIGRISPDSMIQDAVVPRSRLPEVLASAYEIAQKYELRVANVFHAGDGNLHPLICFDSRYADQVRRVKEAGRELMAVCVAAGGTITGEHGVGLDKRELLPLVFSEADMAAMLNVRAAFDPLGLCNPGKIIPMLRGCGEGRAVSQTLEVESQQLATLPVQARKPNHKGKPASEFKAEPAVLRLADIVGMDHLECGSASVIAHPGSTEEIVELVKCASREGWTVAPVGSMTYFASAPPSNLLITTSRLNRVVEHEPADLIAIAESGVRLDTFNAVLAQNGQWLPLDPPNDGRATLGGVVATGLGGMQQLAYGKPRNSVIGMQVVLADGNLIKAGGRVVKNVAGYDLCKLFAGSYGTLGIITELNFKLRPRPAQDLTVVAVGPVAKLISSARSVLESRLFPVGVELLSAEIAGRLGIAIERESSALLIKFAGNRKAVAFQSEQTLKEFDWSKPELIESDNSLWNSLAAISIGERFQWRASVLPSETLKLVEVISRIYGDGFHSALWQLGVADGRMQIISNNDSLLPQVDNEIRKLGGKLFTQSARSLDPPSSSGIMQRIKNLLDPDGLFPTL